MRKYLLRTLGTIVIALTFLSSCETISLPVENQLPSVSETTIEGLLYEDTGVWIRTKGADADGDKIAFEVQAASSEQVITYQRTGYYSSGEEILLLIFLEEGDWVVRVRVRDAMNETSGYSEFPIHVKRPIAGHWARVSEDEISNAYRIIFTDSNFGWVLSYKKLYRTTDGGETWSVHDLPFNTGPNGLVKDIFFSGSSNGWMCGWDGFIARSTNGGVDWSVIDPVTSQKLNRIWFTDSLNGWAVGDKATVLHTEDGGLSWSSVNTGIGADCTAIFFLDKLNGWIGGFLGRLIRTNDGGNTWEHINLPEPSIIRFLFFLDDNTGWYRAYKTHITHDGGKTWDLYGDGAWYFFFHDVMNAWGYISTSNGSEITYTWNGGIDRVEDVLPVENYEIYDITFTDFSVGWAAGNKGLLKSTDAGIQEPVGEFKSSHGLPTGLIASARRLAASNNLVVLDEKKGIREILPEKR